MIHQFFVFLFESQLLSTKLTYLIVAALNLKIINNVSNDLLFSLYNVLLFGLLKRNVGYEIFFDFGLEVKELIEDLTVRILFH